MNRSPILRSPRLRLLLAIAICGLVASAAAVESVNTIGLAPPRITPRHLDVAGAGARVVVDNPRSLLSDRLATDGDFQTLHKRAVLMGSLMVSAPVRGVIARRMGIGPAQLVGRARVTANVQAVLTEPDSEPRATAIAEAGAPYRLEVHPDPILPTLSVYAQAPTLRDAERLADAAAPALREYLRVRAVRAHADPADQVVLEQSGHARGALINGGAKLEIVALTFTLVFALTACALLLGAKLRRERAGGEASSGRARRPAAPEGEALVPRRSAGARIPALGRRLGLPPRLGLAPRFGLLTPALATTGATGSAIPAGALAPIFPPRPAVPSVATLRIGDWPRTTRVLPWMLAAMMAVVWLVPFNVIELSYSLPIDLKFDRLVLPFVIATWVLAIAAGGRHAPRPRLTGIHLAVGGVAAAALLSLVVDARALNQLLELDTSIKKLTLLASYISLFLIVASSVRRREVPAFLRYTLVLAVMCALGTIWEYRFAYNVFYSLSDHLLPGVFIVGKAEPGAVDAIGRRVVRGPGEVPLEAVAMLSMGLPIAVCGLIRSKVTRRRLVYGIATALILAAAASTERKSALLAPASVFVTLAYFRRRELIRLAPLGVVIAAVMLMLTPGAAQSVVSQLSGKKLNSVTTVSDRSSDYDAVRPDVWSHLAFGRGYGSYEFKSYRLLDMELLRELIEVGVIGVFAFVVMIGTVVAVARRPIRARRPDDAAVALSAASAAVVLLVVSTLFDAMAFPHVPYIMLSMAGLLAVVVSQPPDEEPQDRWSS